ncbi:MAG: hypothetical protein OXE42_02905 [Gammaproteobacteria bacterium]|nr:hypothetical protein [Gammaproteobacteria bacterium]
MNLGIDKDCNLFYEGKASWGHAVWPSPVVTPAEIVTELEGRLHSEDRRNLDADGMVFREDSFDPVTRVRRGRFYQAGERQPSEWHVQVHPAVPNEAFRADQGIIKKSLDTFYRHTIWHQFSKCQKQPLVLLGFEDRFTIWNIIDIESISTGEDLVTLKSCSSLGILPEVESSKMPESSRKAVMESLHIFVDEVHRAAPASVIDRARDSVSQVLLAYFDLEGENAKDLSALIKDLERKDSQKVIAVAAAKIIARLHARAKPVEKTKRSLRDICQQDAELAAQCLGVILCELGWANWR